MSASPGRAVLVLVIILAVAGIFGIFLAFGPPGLYAKTESPEFCGSCHVMEAQYESWFHSGAHAQIKCVDCHLPNDTKVRHLTWKAIDGAKDFVAFHMGRGSDPIKISERGAGFVQENCQRCHQEIMARISEERHCWECHRKLTHQGTGVILTWAQE
jgi:cytochrome c nitrite reductase small subunit